MQSKITNQFKTATGANTFLIKKNANDSFKIRIILWLIDLF